MKLLFPILTILTLSFSQDDPRLHNHGTCIVEYYNENYNYYLTWSSAYNYGWEHNIFNSIIHFNNDGDIVIDQPDKLYIGEQWDEAQEPVNSTINAKNNYILSVWEDGSDNDAPNVRGQIHKPDGTIIKSNWIIAGGEGSQHSAQTAHLTNNYLIFYADEAPPATLGAVVKGKVIDDQTGEEKQTIQFSPNNEDHWWPISISNTKNTRTLVLWGNDGYSVMGTVLYDSSGLVTQTSAPKDFIVNTQQYYYHAEWLEELSNFLIIARAGAYESITEYSRVCLIDTLGNKVRSKLISGGILREAKMACKWNEVTKTMHVFYPTKTNSLTHFSINDTGGISIALNQIDDHPDLNKISWESTGIWSTFVRDKDGNDTWKNKHIAFFIQNDTSSNNIIKIPVQLSTNLFNNGLDTIESKYDNFNTKTFTNTMSKYLRINTVNYKEYSSARISIFNIKGQTVLEKTISIKGDLTSIDISKLSSGQYFYKLNSWQ